MAQNLIKLENVYFYYTKIAEPQLDKFDPTGLQKKFGITVALTKADAKEFKKLKLNKTVKELNLPIDFIGKITIEKVHEYYSKSILIFPLLEEKYSPVSVDNNIVGSIVSTIPS